MSGADILEENHIDVTKYWDHYYGDGKLQCQKPSRFSKFCRRYFIQDNDVVFDFGCGDGRDTLYFNKQGLETYACDISEEAISLTKKRLSTPKYNPHNVFRSDVTKLSSAEINVAFNIAYCRFFLHSLTNEQEAVFLAWLSETLPVGGLLLIEARTTKDVLCNDKYVKIDKNTYLYEENHFRRFIVPEDFISVISSYGFELIYKKISNRFSSVNKNGVVDSPELLRAVFKKKG